MYPIILKPHTEHPIWSGKRLRSEYNIDSDRDIGETFNMSTLPKRESIVSNGVLKGLTLTTALCENPSFVKNGSTANGGELPLLFKIIDTNDNLSVQVHPNDDYAKRVENQLGKTESWLILYAAPNAFIYLGFNKNYTRDEVEKAVLNNTVENLLNKIPVNVGDYYYIPSGTVHALGCGITIAEIQQSSMVTYRMYDFNRRDAQGNSRELHLAKALDVLCYEKTDLSSLRHFGATDKENKLCVLDSEKYFEVLSASINKNIAYVYEDFSLLTITEGYAEITASDVTISVTKGQSVFIPKGISTTISGDCKLLVHRIPS